MISKQFRQLALSLVLLTLSVPAFATIKGLNQIPTPDIQPSGVASVTYQVQDPGIGNREAASLEYGLNSKLEISGTYGLSPVQKTLNAELGVYQSQHTLVSTGFLNYTSDGSKPQPFIESGFLNGRTDVVGGYVVKYADTVNRFREDTVESIYGISYRLNTTYTVQADYQAGAENFATAGFNITISPFLSLNPAIEWANATQAPKGYLAVTLSL